MTQEGQEQQKPIDVMAEILEAAGLESINDVPLAMEFAWGKQGVWKSDAVVPLDGYRHLVVFALFQHAAEDVTVYAVPNEGSPTGTFPHRFTLCKRSPAYFVEILRSKDVFVDEIAKEIVLLAMRGAASNDDAGERLWAACMASAMTRLSPKAAAQYADQALDEYNAREDEDEEDEAEAEPNGAAPTANPV